MKIYVGCCGFAGSMKKYFEDFQTVELQSTFYKLPKIETAKKWKEFAPKDFIFSVKAFQAITHPVTSPTWKRSGFKKEELDKISNKLGFLRPTKEVFKFWQDSLAVCKALSAEVCLIQLPASFKYNSKNLENAKKFFSKIRRNSLKLAVEIRGWNSENIKGLCKEFNLIHCTDPFASLPTYLGKDKVAYFRLHGSPPGKKIYAYKYTQADLSKLKEVIDSIDAKRVFVFFNNLYMKEDSTLFKQMLEKA